MSTKPSVASSAFSRRGFLGFAAAAASVPLLAACGGGSASQGGGGGAGGTIKFWDMPWATPAYNDAAKKIAEGFSGANSKASYQIIQWNNFYQTFSSAIASKTGPAVSTGGGFQAFQFEKQGQIAYADKVIEKLKSNGQFDDFLPGVLDPFKSDKGYVAVPWQLDMRVFWYRKSLFEKANVALPTDWPSLLEAGKALKKVGAFGFTTGAGAGNNYANHSMIMMMVNNGGGVFTKDGELDCHERPQRRSHGVRPGTGVQRHRRSRRRQLHHRQHVRPVEGRQSRLRPVPGQCPAARWRHLRRPAGGRTPSRARTGTRQPSSSPTTS